MTMNQMNVIFFGFSFRHHGKNTAFRGIARQLSDCRVIDMSHPWPAILPQWLESRLDWRWLYYSEYVLWPLYQREERHVFHHYHSENTMFRDFRWKKHHRLMATVHQPLYRLLPAADTKDHSRRRLYRECLRACDLVVLPATCEIQAFQEELSIGRCAFVPIGVDCSMFCPAPQEPRMDRPVVLAIGNWLRDYDLWVRVIHIMKDRAKDTEFVLIAGEQTLADVRKKLRGDERNVRLVKGISDQELIEWYRRSTVFFLPLKAAVGNTAMVEALAMGCSIVVTDLPTTREYAGDAALYFPAGDAEVATAHVVRLIEHPEERRDLARRARERACANLDWPVLANKYRQLYRQLLSE